MAFRKCDGCFEQAETTEEIANEPSYCMSGKPFLCEKCREAAKATPPETAEVES